MKISVSVLSLLAVPALLANGQDDAIVGGTQVGSDDKYPAIGSMQISGARHFCTCSLIGPSTVLTAAHCIGVEGLNGFKVRFNSANKNGGGILATVKRIFQHENFNTNNFQNDLAILYLTEPITSITPLKIQPRGQQESGISIGAGWGSAVAGLSSPDIQDILREVKLPVIDTATCKRSDPFYQNYVSSGMVCLGTQSGSQGACNGDSGGPAFQGDTQIGVASWVQPICSSYTVYVRVRMFNDWIEEKMKITEGSSEPPSTPPVDDQCKCVGPDNNAVETGKTCGRWLKQNFSWCYSEKKCNGNNVKPSQTYPGYYKFDCSESKLDTIAKLMIDEVLPVPGTVERLAELEKAEFGANILRDEKETEVSASAGGFDAASLAIGFAVAGVASAAGMFVYKRKMDEKIHAVIDRVENERTVVSTQA